MTGEDLSRLKIDKQKAAFGTRRRRPLSLLMVAILALLFSFFLLQWILMPSIKVRVATVAQVYPTQSFTLLNASGYVVPQRKAALASKVTGRLVWLGVEEGSRVKKGQVVARLESEDAVAAREEAAARLSAARANLAQAKAELQDATLAYNRYQELFAKGAVAQATYDSVVARYEKALAAAAAAEAMLKAAAAALNAAEVTLKYTEIRAPFEGVVLTKNADIGDIVTPIGAAANAKSAVITIADMGSLQVEVDVSEMNIQKIALNQPCEVILDALPDQRLRGTIHMIVPTADRSKATVTVKVRLLDRDDRILPEMSAKVAFLARAATDEEQRPRVAVNKAAIAKHDGKEVIFLIEGKRVKMVPVRLGDEIGEMVEVLSGVKVGDRVVLAPPKRMREGSRIKVVEQ